MLAGVVRALTVRGPDVSRTWARNKKPAVSGGFHIQAAVAGLAAGPSSAQAAAAFGCTSAV